MLSEDESLSDRDRAFSKHVVALYVTYHNIPTNSCVDIARGTAALP
jgi:hypothetical protein